jgi:hypothetical protein
LTLVQWLAIQLKLWQQWFLREKIHTIHLLHLLPPFPFLGVLILGVRHRHLPLSLARLLPLSLARLLLLSHHAVELQAALQQTGPETDGGQKEQNKMITQVNLLPPTHLFLLGQEQQVNAPPKSGGVQIAYLNY